MTAPNFHSRLKTAIGAPGVPLVFLGNLEVEEQWARGECGLPRVSSSSGVAVVNRMDEFALLLACGGDHVVLKSAPEESYLRYLTDLGIDLPKIHAVGKGDPQRTVTEDALADQSVLDALCSLGALGARLIPHGVSEVEERLVASTGLTLGAPTAAICKTVNSKVYSRRAADELGIPQPKGWAATTLDELEAAVTGAAEVLGTGQKVVLKEALGVSGKGISVVDAVPRLRRLQRMIAKQVAKGGYERIGFVIEEWVAKRSDLNYQFTLAADGSVHFDFVKEAITEGGVHKGHRFPAALSESQVDILRMTAEQLGKKLHSDGFFGVVGVDAIVGPEGEIHPVIEINARHNMSTYQIRLQDRFLGQGQVAIARHYGLRLDAPLPFAEARATLADLLWTAESREGLLINNYATVNAAAAAGGTGFDGRLYGLIVANSVGRAAELDRAITARLTRGARA